MKKFIMVLVLLIAATGLSLSYSASDAKTFNNGYQWSGHPGKDHATQWAIDIQAITEAGYNIGTGEIFHVDSNATGNAEGDTWTNAALTLDAGIGLCTASRGDFILVAQGHSETFVTQSLDVDVIGVTIIGMGNGSLRPTITYNHANAETAIGANNCTIVGIRFLTSITDVLMGIEVEDGVDYFTIAKCDFVVDLAGTDDFLEAINFVNDNTGCIISNCYFNAKAGAANSAIMLDADTDQLTVIGCDIRGDYAVACINGDTAASTDLYLLDNRIVNGALLADGGLNAQPAIELLDSTAGLCDGNVFAADVATGLLIRVADDMCFIQNWIADSDGDDKAGATESTSATITVFVDGG